MAVNLRRTIETFISKARNIDEVELDKFYDKILKTTKEVENLRQLFLILHFTKYGRKLPSDVANALLATVCDHLSEPRVIQLSLLILLEASPLPALFSEELITNLDKKSIVKLLPLLPLQNLTVVEKPKLISRLLVLLKHSPSVMDHLAILTFIGKSLNFHLVENKEHVDFLNEHLIKVLRKTSVFQAPNPHTSNLFRRTDCSELITELDGRPAQEFFTILNLARYNTNDQFVNICGFSLVRNWLNYLAKQTTTSDIPSCQVLIKGVSEYCIRIIDQSYILANVPEDIALQKASVLEAIHLLDLICSVQPICTVTVFNSIKRLHQNIIEDFSDQAHISIIFTATLQFFLHHGAVVGYDVENALQSFFTDHISKLYWKVDAAFEYVQFLLENALLLSEKYNCFVKYFPCIFKILAWHPNTLREEFSKILTVSLCNTTAVEMLYLILDLPCLTASLILSRQESMTKEPPESSALSIIYALNKELSSSKYKPMFAFMVRDTSGKGDTFNRIQLFLEFLKPIASGPRISCCASLVSVYLRYFFQNVLEMNDKDLLGRLLPVMLERVNLLYAVPKLDEQVQHVLADNLLVIFKQHSSLVIEVYDELLDYLSHVQHIVNAELFYTHVLWIVGEYLSSSFDTRCTAAMITTMYDVLESTVYEVQQMLHTDTFHPKVIVAFMTTLAKFSSRSQDLIPRARLCLSKTNNRLIKLHDSYGEENIKIAVDRINQLTLLLRNASMVSVILNPPLEATEGRWHRQNTSTPFVLKSISGILTNIKNK